MNHYVSEYKTVTFSQAKLHFNFPPAVPLKYICTLKKQVFRIHQRFTDLTSTLRAPRGVTRVAGAKAYAAKLAASPAPTVKADIIQIVASKKMSHKHDKYTLHCQKFGSPPSNERSDYLVISMSTNLNV